MDNPYLRKFERTKESLHNAETRLWASRQELVQKYAWAVPSSEAIELLKSYSPLIEMGAGNGYWAWMILQAGGKIVAYDRYVSRKAAQWGKVKLGSVEKIPEHPGHTLFLCWPPFNTSLAFDSLMKYEGDTVIFVGEAEGGCTGDDDFFTFLEANYELVKELEIPSYPFVHDQVWVYKRK